LLSYYCCKVMRRSGFFLCHKMKCNAMWTGYFSCVDLLITINFCICIFGNLFSYHFHLVCYLCIVHDLNVSFHYVMQWVFAYNNYLKDSVEKFLIKLMKISNVKRFRSYIRPLTKAPCSGSSETLNPSSICSKRKVGSLEGLQVKSNPKSQPCLNGKIITWRTTSSS